MPASTIFNIDSSILQAPMAGAQGSALAIAVSNAGGLGALPCAMLGPDALRQELAAIRAQKELPQLNRLSPDQSTYFAGAWFKYGFHEDGLASALDCARALTGEALWG